MKIFGSTILLLFYAFVCNGQVYQSNTAKVDFVSDAPLEMIKASSSQLQGILDLEKKTFAFKMKIKSFEGFNSPLQQIHFYENYLETDEFPTANFVGKIIEPIQSETSKYRAKGFLKIHGVSVERIIDVELLLNGEEINFNSTFIVPLQDHSIDLPRIVFQKIADDILVSVSGQLQKVE